MEHSVRAVAGMTAQIKAQWKFLQNDLKQEKKSLEKAKSFTKYNLLGTKT